MKKKIGEERKVRCQAEKGVGLERLGGGAWGGRLSAMRLGVSEHKLGVGRARST